MIEWVAVAAAVGPHIKNYAAARADKIADGVLARTYRRILPGEKLLKANEAFVARFGKELDSTVDLSTLTARPYQDALKVLLANPSTQDVLTAPLDGSSELNWKLLRGFWDEMCPIPLPAEFDWPKVARTYSQAVHKLMLVDANLRPVISAIANIRSAEATERAVASLAQLVGPQRAFNLTRYAAALKTAYGHLRLGAIDSDWTQYERRVRLERIYVPQSAKQALPPLDLTRDYLRSTRSADEIAKGEGESDELARRREQYANLGARPILELVESPSNQRLVILGDPGLGKSTLLRLFALKWADDPTRPLTIYVELRRVAPNADGDIFLNHLANGADSTCCLPGLALHDYLVHHDSMVLLDGLDEVGATRRDDTVSQIIRFAEDYPMARVVVTTRIQGYSPGSTHPDQFRDAGFVQFTLQDFSEDQIERFIDLWHQEVFADLDERAKFVRRLETAISESPAILELAANPLLLTLMAVLSRNQDLPRERAKLYERCADLLLKNWDLEKFPELRDRSGLRDIKDKLGPDQKTRILEQVAAAMQEEQTGLAANLIAEEKLKTIMERELAKLDIPQPWSVASDLTYMLRERNFMLAYLGGDQYGFVHRTFLEYFCAREIVHRLEKTSSYDIYKLRELYRQCWRRPEWHEIMRLVCGLIGVEYAAACISELIASEGLTGGEEALLLGAQCLAEIRETGQVREVRRRTRDGLLRLTEFDLPHFPEPGEEDMAAEVRRRAIRGLASAFKSEPDTPTLMRKLAVESGFDDVRAEALDAFASYWGEDLSTHDLLIDRAQNDRSPSVNAVAIQHIAEDWAGDPATLVWLKGKASRLRPWRAREMAVHEVADGWTHDPDTLPWIKECASDRSNGARRWAALEMLAEHWASDPDTIELLRRSVFIDEHHHVRNSALRSLVEISPDRPETALLLRDRGSRDAEEELRFYAVSMLAELFENDKSTLDWLKVRAVADPDEPIRARAVDLIARRFQRHPDALAWLEDRAANDASEWVRLYAQAGVVRAAGNPSETLLWLKADDRDPEFRNAATQTVGSMYRTYTDTLPWLKCRAENDAVDRVRASAVKVVARTWGHELTTLNWLKSRAGNDSDGEVRAVAIAEVARGWRDDPRTSGWLRDACMSDASASVRLAAIRALARGWRDEAGTLAQLKQSAQSDDDAEVRRAALSELNRGWKNAPDTLAMLLDRATCDQGEVRVEAIELILKEHADSPKVGVVIKKCVTEGNDDKLVGAVLYSRHSVMFEDDPKFIGSMLKRAAKSPDVTVRSSALIIIADEAGECGPEFVKALKHHCVDPEATRGARAELLFRIARRKDSELLHFLKERAVNDPDEHVRVVALHCLLRYCDQGPETFEVVLERFNNDSDPGIRQTCLWEMAGRWGDNPAVQQLVHVACMVRP
jgi:hypothetical protein